MPKPLEDDDEMPFGKHRGKRMVDVPDDYFLYMYNEGFLTGRVFDYVIENLEAIKYNVKDAKNRLR